MAPTKSITAHVAVVVAVLCLAGAKLSAACNGAKSNSLAPIIPPGTPSSAAAAGGKCPVDVAKLGVCASVLDGLIHAVVVKAAPPKQPCCPLIAGLADVDAAVCVCLAIKTNVVGVNLDVPVDLSLLVNYCGRKVPEGFQCA